MKFPLATKKQTLAIANGTSLIIFGISLYLGHWLTGICLAIGMNLAIRQLLSGRKTDFFITLGVFLSIATITLISIKFSIFVPLALILSGLYMICKEYFIFNKMKFNFDSNKKLQAYDGHEKR